MCYALIASIGQNLRGIPMYCEGEGSSILTQVCFTIPLIFPVLLTILDYLMFQTFRKLHETEEPFFNEKTSIIFRRVAQFLQICLLLMALGGVGVVSLIIFRTLSYFWVFEGVDFCYTGEIFWWKVGAEGVLWLGCILGICGVLAGHKMIDRSDDVVDWMGVPIDMFEREGERREWRRRGR